MKRPRRPGAARPSAAEPAEECGGTPIGATPADLTQRKAEPMKLTHRMAAVCALTLGSLGSVGPLGLTEQAMAAPFITDGPVSVFCNNPVNLGLVAAPGGSGLLGQTLNSLGLGGGGGYTGTGGSGTSSPSQDGTPTGG